MAGLSGKSFGEGTRDDSSDPGKSKIRTELIESPYFEVGLYSVGTDVDGLDTTISHLKEIGYETAGPVIPTSAGRQRPLSELQTQCFQSNYI